MSVKFGLVPIQVGIVTEGGFIDHREVPCGGEKVMINDGAHKMVPI